MHKPGNLKYGLLLVLLIFLTGCPPFPVTILLPLHGEHFSLGEEILFSGSASDLLEGELTGTSLVWISGKDGQIGTGTSFSRDDLTMGTHTITLTAKNSIGEEGTATITITVGDEISTTTTTVTTLSTTVPLTTTSTTISTDATTTTTASDTSSTTISGNCPPDFPVECENGCCSLDSPVCCDNGCCFTDYPICGEGADEGECFADESSTTTTTAVSGQGDIVLSVDPANDLLFYSIHEDGFAAYYHGYDSSGGMELTHVITDDGTTVIFNDDFIPIQWITDDLTIAVYRTDDEQPFDPSNAFHVVADGSNESSFTIDIYPDNLQQILNALEAYTGTQFSDASNFLTTYAISSFSDLTSRAKQDGQDQARFIAASVGFSAAAAFLGMEAEGIVSKSSSSITPLQNNILVQAAAGLLASKFNDEYGPGGSSDPDSPTVEVLLCRGVSSYIICHYMFFKRPGLAVGPCVDLCLTSMRCFTDICMPKTLSADTAMGLINHHSGS
jgi:hypothetical protein